MSLCFFSALFYDYARNPNNWYQRVRVCCAVPRGSSEALFNLFIAAIKEIAPAVNETDASTVKRLNRWFDCCAVENHCVQIAALERKLVELSVNLSELSVIKIGAAAAGEAAKRSAAAGRA